MNETIRNKIQQNYHLITEANQQMFEIWKTEIVFTWQWWLNVSLTIIPWALWILFRKKGSTIRLLSVGFFVIIISSWFDFIGIALGLWYYMYEVIHFIPNYITLDFSLLPVTIMFFIQIKPKSNPFIKAIIFSGITSFFAEPLFIWLDIYHPLHWKHIYSFPIYLIIYLIAHYISQRNTWDKL